MVHIDRSGIHNAQQRSLPQATPTFSDPISSTQLSDITRPSPTHEVP
jgi:hypothetical protein